MQDTKTDGGVEQRARDALFREGIGAANNDPLLSLSACHREVARCRRNLDIGGSVDFWRVRLERAAQQYEACAAVLRMQLAALDARTPKGPGDE